MIIPFLSLNGILSYYTINGRRLQAIFCTFWAGCYFFAALTDQSGGKSPLGASPQLFFRLSTCGAKKAVGASAERGFYELKKSFEQRRFAPFFFRFSA
ncbi:MAG: hypothetical protein K2N29_06760, partial [Ruminiclostridium sp.]|nr:hypothetical protein [Ruminiclostridium sp.]